MTLDIRKYLENLINKEATISHFSVEVNAGKANKVKGAIASAISQEYGELFLNDADYVLFFTKNDGWTTKDIQKIFELTDRALGKDANKLTKNDFMKLPSTETSEPIPSDDEDDVAEPKIQEETTITTLFVKITIK